MLKSSLLAATALVALGSITAAEAATAPALKISGVYSTAVVFGDDGNPKNDHISFEDSDAYLVFNIEGVADNGLTYGARAQFRGTNNKSDRVKDNYVYFSGAFGRIEFGGLKGVATKMSYAGPNVDGAGMITVNSPAELYYPAGMVAPTGWGSVKTVSTFSNLSGRSEKLNYYTPRIEGFQLGLTYAPHGCSDGSSVPKSGPGSTAGGGVCAISGGFESTTDGQPKQDFEVALNFNREFSGVNLGLSASYAYQEAPDNYAGQPSGVSLQDRHSYGVGGNLKFAVADGKLTVGGAYLHVDNAGYLDHTNADNYEAGLQYAQGPWTVGVEGAYGRFGTVSTGSIVATQTAEKIFALGVGGGYQLAQGLTLSAGYLRYDYRLTNATVSAPDAANVFLVGTKLTF